MTKQANRSRKYFLREKGRGKGIIWQLRNNPVVRVHNTGALSLDMIKEAINNENKSRIQTGKQRNI